MQGHFTGSIVSLQICPGHRKPMTQVASADMVGNLGLKGDMHAIGDSPRQVLLIEKETLDALGLVPGDVKENITTVGILLMGLPSKTRLRVGTDAIVEITKPCSPCHRMDEIRPGLLVELAGRRGMLARVVTPGVVHRGDAVTVVDR
ncbi:MAG TPA: MOSC domain-containing protein [Bacteroidota bacterium]|nr:MOSC domain-containing protein [Bacteroidota bacterium]